MKGRTPIAGNQATPPLPPVAGNPMPYLDPNAATIPGQRPGEPDPNAFLPSGTAMRPGPTAAEATEITPEVDRAAALNRLMNPAPSAPMPMNMGAPQDPVFPTSAGPVGSVADSLGGAAGGGMPGAPSVGGNLGPGGDIGGTAGGEYGAPMGPPPYMQNPFMKPPGMQAPQGMAPMQGIAPTGGAGPQSLPPQLLAQLLSQGGGPR